MDPHQRHLAAVSQDRRLNIFSVKTGKPIHSLRPDPVDDPGLDGANAVGGLLKLCIDSSGRFAATVGSDKCIRTFNLSTGTVVSRLVGHSEIITGLAFSLDMRRLVSTGGDGLVLVWKVSPELNGISSRHVYKDEFVDSMRATSEEELDDVDDGMHLQYLLYCFHTTIIVKTNKKNNFVVSEDISESSGTSVAQGPIRDFISFKDEDLPAWARPPRVQQPSQQDPSAALPKKGLWANVKQNTTIEPLSCKFFLKSFHTLIEGRRWPCRIVFARYGC
jgi:WD40 repeat protein